MENNISKRTFLGYVAAVPAALAALKLVDGGSIVGSARAAETAKKTGPFTLPKLPYANTALEKAIDAQTMMLHHDKHHQAYVDKLNDEVAKDKNLAGKSIEDIIGNISKYSKAARDNGGGHWNHSFFWKTMSPQPSSPSSDLAAAIDRDFGSMDGFRKKFEEAGAKQFGSGWVWLISRGGKLEVTSTPNQDNPLMDDAKVKGTPILGNDVWEHAYYLRYFNKRPDYLKAWWGVVNWKAASDIYAGTITT